MIAAGFPPRGVAFQIRNRWPGQRCAPSAGHRVDRPAL